MSVRAHPGKSAPALKGRFCKFVLVLEKPPTDFLIPDPEPASNSSKLPYVLMHMPKGGRQTRVACPEPATAVDDVVHTPVDAPSTGAGSETTPERPASSEDGVTGLIERLDLAGAATNSGGGTGAGDGGGGAQDIALALRTLALKDCCAHCGKQCAVLKRCSTCKEIWYCGAECQQAAWKGHKKSCAPPLPLRVVQQKVLAAMEANDAPGLLKWEGRLEELLQGWPLDGCDAILTSFINARMDASGQCSPADRASHSISIYSLHLRRVELLGKMERYRDQGNCMCSLAENLNLLSKYLQDAGMIADPRVDSRSLERMQEAMMYCQRARDLGAAHGFYSVESRACMGLGLFAVHTGRHQEGLDLLRNALVYPKP